MRTRVALFFILAIGIVSGAQLSSIILTTTPREAEPNDLWLFFISLYVCLTAIVTLLWYGVRHLRRQRINKPPLFSSFRQAALLCLVFVLSLYFNTLGIFQFWDVIPLAIAAILIEFFFQAEKKPHATLTYESKS